MNQNRTQIRLIVSDVNEAWANYGIITNTDTFQIRSISRQRIKKTRKIRTEVFQIKSIERRSEAKIERKRTGEIFWGACNTDIDNHVDTHCFGRNFCPIFWTSKGCTVSLFLAEYSEQVNIPICTVTTSYTLPSGEVIILVFGQGLWFGDRMEKLLINPN